MSIVSFSGEMSGSNYSNDAARLDMDPHTDGFQDYTTPLADTNDDGIRNVDEVLMSLDAFGRTNYEAGLQRAIEALGAVGSPAGTSNVIFMSDGQPNRPTSSQTVYADEVNTIRNTLAQNLRAFGVGNNVNLTRMRTLDPNAAIFTSTDQLLDIFSGAGSSGGITDTLTTTITVQNVSPTATGLAGPTSLNEGDSGTFSLSGEFDPSSLDLDALRYSFALSSGGLANSYAAAGTSNSFNHLFADPGDFTVHGRVFDDDGGFNTYFTSVTIADVTPPATALSVAGSLGDNGWYRSSVSVSLRATDSFSGVKKTFYRLDGAAWQAYLGSFAVSTEGVTLLEYYSTDMAGNEERAKSATLMIDTMPPVTTHSLAGTLGAGGWYSTPVEVTLSATDDSSGVATTFFQIVGNSVVTYSGPFTIPDEGITTVNYWSVDMAGNVEEVKSFELQVDTTPPVANGQNLMTDEDVPLAVTLTGSDVWQPVVTFQIVGRPSHGTLSDFDANAGTVTYTPAPFFKGLDSFTFLVNDGNFDSDPATVIIEVIAVANEPLLSVQSPAAGVEGTPIPLDISSELVDTSGSESLLIRIDSGGVGFDGVTFSAGFESEGFWLLQPHELPGLEVTFADDGTRNWTVRATAEESSNSDQATTTAGLVVEVANSPPTVTADDASVTVNEGQTASNFGTFFDSGEDNVTITASIGTVVVPPLTQEFANSGTWTWSLATTDGATESQTVTITADDGEGGFSSVTFDLVVDNVAPTAILEGPGTVTYGTTAVVELTSPLDSSSADTAAGFRYAYAVDDVSMLDGLMYADLAGSPASVALDLGAGTYTVYARIFDKDDGFTQYETQVVITPATLTVEADHQTKIYGDADPALTFVVSGFQYGDTAATVLSGELARDPGEDVGTYAIHQGTLTPNGNYTLAFTGHDLLITPAPLTVTADGAQREYGDANPIFTGTIVGIKNNDAISASYASTATPTSSIGDYAIVPTLDDPDNRLSNYDVTIHDGTLTVAAATLTVDVDDATWEISTPFPTFTGTLAGEKNGELFEVVYSSVADETSTVGQYPITAEVAGDTLSNYDVVVHEGTLTVTQATVRLAIRPPSLNINSNGAVSIVLFGSDFFDATEVSVDGLSFAGAQITPFNRRFADLNRDGRQDLLLHFRMTDDVRTALFDIYDDLLADHGRGSSPFKQTALLAVDGVFGQYDQEFIGSDVVDLIAPGR